MSHYFLGIDIGATKTHGLIVDESGRAIGFGEAGPGNHEVVGYEGLTQAVCAATHAALSMAGIRKDQIIGAGFGVAGYDWPSEREPTLRAIEPLGLQAPLEIVNDTIVGLLAGASEGWGVAVVAGSSCNCRGWDRDRREGRVIGHSWMGEAAGAGELVMKAIHAVAHEWTRRGPPTHLTQAFVAEVGAASVEDLLEGLSLGHYHLGAAAAPVVFQVAAEGDLVARELIVWAGRELGDLACGVIRQLGFESETFEVVLVGSLYDGSPALVGAMRETIHAVAPGARLVRLSAPPVVGGVLLGMEQAGLNPLSVRGTLIQSTQALLNRRKESF